MPSGLINRQNAANVACLLTYYYDDEDGLFMHFTVCIALCLDQVLHLVQPHHVYDQVYV